MNKKPLFSIIVPVYNTEKYLKKCLESIVNQTFDDYEVIIVNDGSTDGSEKILEQYKQNEKIKIVKEKNQGLSVARNTGVDKSSGNYLLFIDSDDYIELNLLEELYKNIVDEPDIVRYQLRVIEKNTNYDYYEQAFDITDGIKAFNMLEQYKYIDVAPLYLINKTFYRNNNFEFKKNIYHEDFDLIPKIISKAKKIKSINFIGYNYIMRNNSIMSDRSKEIKKFEDCLEIYKNLKDYFKEKKYKEFMHFYSSSLMFKYFSLNKDIKKNYKEKVKYLGILNYLDTSTFKRKLKKIYYLLKFEVGI